MGYTLYAVVICSVTRVILSTKRVKNVLKDGKAKMAASIREQTKPRAQTAQPIGRSVRERQMYMFEDNGDDFRQMIENQQQQQNSSIYTGNPSNLGIPVRTGPGHLGPLPISVPASNLQSKTMPSLNLANNGGLQELSLGSLADGAEGLGSPTMRG